MFHLVQAMNKKIDSMSFVNESIKSVERTFSKSDDITEEETEFEAERASEDDIEYQIIHKQRRKKIIPNNGEAISYSDWKVYQEYREPIKKYHKETKEIECGFIERGDFQYQ